MSSVLPTLHLVARSSKLALSMAGLAIAIILTAGLNACRQKLTPTAVLSTDRVTITLACRDHERIEYQRLAKILHEAHPTITVQVLSRDAIVGNDQQEALRKLAIAVDTFTFGDNPTLLRSQKGLLRDLSPFIKADRSFQPGDFYPGTLDQFQWDEGTWGLPARAYPILVYYDKVMFYNKDLFDEAGVAYPQPGWNLDDFLEKAVALTEGEGETRRYGYTPLNSGPADLMFFMEQRGASLLDAGGKPIPLDAPQMIEALRWYTNLVLKYGVMPPFRIKDELGTGGWRLALEKRSALVSTRRAAMWTDYPGNSRAGLGLSYVGTAPLPLGTGGRMTQNKIWGYFISADTSHPEACWQWIKFLTGQPAVVRGVPPRRSLLEAPEYRRRVGEEALETYRFALEHGDNRLWEEVNPWLYQAFDVVMDGAAPEQALAEAQRKYEAFQACVEGPSKLPVENLYNTCGKEVDPNFYVLH